MLLIRREQMEAIARTRQMPLVDGLCGEIRRRYSRRVDWLTDSALRRRVRDGLRLARRHGLDTGSSRATFVILMFAVSPHFAEHPAFAAILDDHAVPADARMRLLLTQATAADWRAAARRTEGQS